jgi:hypothetical protein
MSRLLLVLVLAIVADTPCEWCQVHCIGKCDYLKKDQPAFSCCFDVCVCENATEQKAKELACPHAKQCKKEPNS